LRNFILRPKTHWGGSTLSIENIKNFMNMIITHFLAFSFLANEIIRNSTLKITPQKKTQCKNGNFENTFILKFNFYTSNRIQNHFLFLIYEILKFKGCCYLRTFTI